MFVVKIYDLDGSSFKINDVRVKVFKTLEESKKFVVEKHYEIDYDNCNTDLSLEEFLNEFTGLYLLRRFLLASAAVKSYSIYSKDWL